MVGTVKYVGSVGSGDSLMRYCNVLVLSTTIYSQELAGLVGANFASW